jgi:hypothetical protein
LLTFRIDKADLNASGPGRMFVLVHASILAGAPAWFA